MASRQFLIVGGGLAAAKAADALRDKGFDGTITLISTEPHLPYERPPLSKGFLMGKAGRDSVFVHDASWYTEHNVELRLGVAATSLDRTARHVELADGTRLRFDKLLLATGASPRQLPSDRNDYYLRTLDDSEALRNVLAKPDGHLAIIGAGWIGLEAAAAAREAGLRVTVLETLALPLLRVLGPEVAQVFADLHVAHGVDLRLGDNVTSVDDLAADAVLVGIGAMPNVELAQEAGLDVNNGITVDEHLRTSDPDIFAVGDVANAYHPLLKKQIRVEHWANALNQPAVAAANMLGENATYDRIPYFYTDQYDLGMEYTGYVEPGGYDSVVFRGDVESREFIAFWLRDNRVLAGMNVNVWDVGDPIKELIRSGRQINPEALTDVSNPLDEL